MLIAEISSYFSGFNVDFVLEYWHEQAKTVSGVYHGIVCVNSVFDFLLFVSFFSVTDILTAPIFHHRK